MIIINISEVKMSGFSFSKGLSQQLKEYEVTNTSDDLYKDKGMVYIKAEKCIKIIIDEEILNVNSKISI